MNIIASSKVSKAMPAAASTTVNLDGIDVKGGSFGQDVALGDIDLVVEVPDMILAKLPNTSVLTVKIEESDDDSTYSTLYDVVETFTGATGTATLAGDQIHVGLPRGVKQYVRAVLTTDSNGADMSALTAYAYLAR